MEIDTVIKLKNGKKYLLLMESELDLVGYYLAILLDDNNEPTNTYTVLEEVNNNGKMSVKTITDTLILNKLLEDYQLQYDDLIAINETE